MGASHEARFTTLLFAAAGLVPVPIIDTLLWQIDTSKSSTDHRLITTPTRRPLCFSGVMKAVKSDDGDRKDWFGPLPGRAG